MYYLGIDLGTSAVKMLLLDEEQRPVRKFSRSYPISYPAAGWSEQRPEDWWAAVKEGLQELADFARGDIASIALSGQMHGLVCLDKEGQVLRPAMLWNDSRAQAETTELNEGLGVERLLEETGNIAFAGFTAPKILWLRAHEPDCFRRTRWMLLPKDYINFCLTGGLSTDCSDASGTLLFDVRRRRWSQQMLDFCAVDETMLGKVYESWMPVGRLHPDLASELGIRGDCQVAAGASDNAAAALGTGVLGKDACMVSLGTSGTVLLSGAYRQVAAPYGVHSFAHADGAYLLLGCMLAAASCVGWWSEQILHTKPEDMAIAAPDPRMAQLFFLPYLMGERSPHNDPSVRGAFIGLDMEQKREDLSRAILEGVAFGLRDSLEQVREQGLEIRRLRLCGGGARNPLWQHILAAVFRCDIELLEAEEGAALGAALLAAVCAGRFCSVKEAVAKTVRVRETIRPQADWLAFYEAKYRDFSRLYPALRGLCKAPGTEKIS